jgi:hypothetical protein
MISLSSARATSAIALATVLSGCEVFKSSTSPTAPAAAVSSPSRPFVTIILTVRVLTRGSEQPVQAATVFRNSAAVGQTDADGMLRAEVLVGVEVSIDVSAPGFVGYGATATVTGPEQWTFYLEPA